MMLEWIAVIHERICVTNINAPKADDAQVKIRLDQETKHKIKVLAAINRRTVSREIEHRVIESVNSDPASFSISTKNGN